MTGASQQLFAGRKPDKKRERASNPGSNPGSRILYYLIHQYLSMPVETKEISVMGKEDCGIIDITENVSDAVKNSKIRNGAVTIFCIGSTGAITTMEYEAHLSKGLLKNN